MSRSKSNAGYRLRQLKKQHQQQLKRLKEEASKKLLNIEHKLHEQLYAQHFYSGALLNLLISEDLPESDSLMGAITLQRSLRQSGQELSTYIAQFRVTIGR